MAIHLIYSSIWALQLWLACCMKPPHPPKKKTLILLSGMHLWHWYQSSNLLSDKTQFVRICSSWQMKLVALGGLVKHWESAGESEMEHEFEMLLKYRWVSSILLKCGRPYTLSHNLCRRCTLFSLCQMHFFFLMAPCPYVYTAITGVQHVCTEKMSTRAELLGRFCIEDGAQNAGLPISRTVGTPVLNGACCAYSDFTNWISPLPFFRSCWTNLDRCTFRGGGEKRKKWRRDWARDVGRWGKWNEEGMEMTARAGEWEAEAAALIEEPGAGSRTDGFDCASRRTWRWREQRG